MGTWASIQTFSKLYLLRGLKSNKTLIAREQHEWENKPNTVL